MLSKMFNNKHLIFFLLSIILLVILMWSTVGSRDLSWPEKFLKDSISMTQGALYKPANKVAGFFEDIRDFTLIFKENKSLKASLQQYSQVVAELNQVKEENKRLKEMVDYKQSVANQYHLKMAEVIGRSPDRWNNMIVIDKGAKDGISKDMAVVSTQGLIGKVYSVSNFSSNVQMISDTEHGGFVFAEIQSNPISYGVIGGYDPITRELTINKIELNAEIEEGQLVVTSNLGGTFPPGIVIGEITKLEQYGSGELTKTAFVKPAADLYHIKEVFIVEKDFQPEEIAVSGTTESVESEKEEN